MNNTRPDVIEILELEKKYHADQIRRINVAIAALKGNVSIEETTPKEQPQQKKPRSVQWTSEIKDIFESNDVFTPEEVRDRLVEKGIVEAMSNQGKNSIYSTFSRLKKAGYLEQPEYGKYRKKQPAEEKRFRRRLDLPIERSTETEKNEGSESSNHPEPS